MVTQSMWHALALVGQYLLPLLCLAGAVVSGYSRHRRSTLITTVASSTAADVLDGITWQEFELLVGEAFRLKGYEVQEHGGSAPDGGIDLVLRRNGEKILVQCKQWKAFSVGVGVVRELYGVMAANGAAGGFVVTSGRFTEAAKAFAAGRNVTLMDGAVLKTLIGNSRATRDGAASPATRPAAVPQTTAATPQCPTCGGNMVQRAARRGATSGSVFWGCSSFPACRGTRPVA